MSTTTTSPTRLERGYDVLGQILPKIGEAAKASLYVSLWQVQVTGERDAILTIAETLEAEYSRHFDSATDHFEIHVATIDGILVELVAISARTETSAA